MRSTAAYLTGVSARRTYEPVGHAYHPPVPCHDCGTLVPDLKGMERGGVKRCGPCDIRFCDSVVQRVIRCAHCDTVREPVSLSTVGWTFNRNTGAATCPRCNNVR